VLDTRYQGVLGSRMTSHPVLITIPRVAEMFGVTPETVRQWVKEDKLRPVILPSGSKRFRVEDIERILAGTPAT
jgi:predicted site-specific integrase-resolvase